VYGKFETTAGISSSRPSLASSSDFRLKDLSFRRVRILLIGRWRLSRHVSHEQANRIWFGMFKNDTAIHLPLNQNFAVSFFILLTFFFGAWLE